MLKANHISHTFTGSQGTTEALRDVSLTLSKGEFVAVVGPSGSGKSTLLNILAGLLTPTQGSVTLNGHPSTGPSRERGVVFQDFTLFPWLTVWDNIAFGPKNQGLSEAEINKIVGRYLTQTGLTQFKSAYPKALSGGMKQRVAIARTLANSSAILLLDEPFGALDVQTRSQMQEFLAKIWEEERKTTVLVTHDVEEALYLADRVVILSTKPGTVKEIVPVPFAHPRRSELRYQQEFLQLKKYVSYSIRSEFIKATTDSQLLQAQEDQLVIGSNIWPGIAPLYLAQEKGLAAKHDVAFSVATLEWSHDRLKPWREGTVDALNTPLDSALVEYATSPDLRILMPLDLSVGGDAILARRPITSLQGLKHKRVGVEKGWVSHFFLAYALAEAGLSLRDVTLKDMKASDIGSAIIGGSLAAGSLQEPWLAKALELSDTTMLVSSKDLPPMIFAVLVVKESTWQQKRAAFERLRAVWANAIQLYTAERAEAIKLMAPYLGMSEIELAEQLALLRFVDPSYDLLPALQATQQILLKEQWLKQPLDLEKLLLLR